MPMKKKKNSIVNQNWQSISLQFFCKYNRIFVFCDIGIVPVLFLKCYLLRVQVDAENYFRREKLQNGFSSELSVCSWLLKLTLDLQNLLV